MTTNETGIDMDDNPVQENWLEVTLLMENVRRMRIHRRNIKVMAITSFAATYVLLGLTIALSVT